MLDTVVDWVFVLARVLVAGAVAWSAVRYGFGGVGMTWADSYRSPFPKYLKQFCALAAVVAAVAVIVGAWADIAALVLVALMLWITYRMHPWWSEHDPNARAGQKVHFIKNFGLIGGALLVFYVYYRDADTFFSLTDSVLGDKPASGN